MDSDSDTNESRNENNGKNWFVNQFSQRLEKVQEAGAIRNENQQKSIASSKRYDELKKALYQTTDAAYIEGIITETLKDFYISRIKSMDRESLNELKSFQKKDEVRKPPAKRRRFK